MKTFSADLTAHLATGETTLCYCWVIERLDAQIFGFTDHDEDVTVNGVTCLSSTGITTTKIVQSLGLAVDNLEISGIIDGETLTTLDIESGLFDNASVKLYIVNWDDTTQYNLRANGTFGAVSETEGDVFATEFRSQSHILGQPEGRVFQRMCDTKLGSAKCGVDTSDPAFSMSGTIVSHNGHTVVVNGADAYADDWFTLGTFTDPDGGVHGIKTHVGTTLTLWQEPVVTFSVGTSVGVVAGCKQHPDECRVKFDNMINFQGFPLMPGNDRLTDYPVRGQDNYDGGSLFQ